MYRVLPWLLSLILSIAFAVSLSELQKAKRISEVAQQSIHNHRNVRQFIISAAMARTHEPIVVLGDSIVEMAALPLALRGVELVNAGIGGIRASELAVIAPRLLDGFKPKMLVVALGTNDAGSTGSDFSSLLTILRTYTPNLVGVSTTNDPATLARMRERFQQAGVPFIAPEIRDGGKLTDAIHFNKRGYETWIASLVNQILRMM
ncbi:SGNH/GDSL hydrolase family protein [Bradyrhizobium neotropicale]|uniref:SGNH hydrolase-type esterase domain-containing protein n=1 Tax=Bradyrhizobium neotropicale TaxID=1497615 RepID=A0A176Z876_9BRAD|nr:SGNH/GDSL hydrolase family protein [Bradyrhizobium neotropicale]OAF16920.1 hypothetical protein AXW67_00145 [Bradyrhizobium neotropicale]